MLWNRHISEYITHSSDAWSLRILVDAFDLGGRPDFLRVVWRHTWVCWSRGKQILWGIIIHRGKIFSNAFLASLKIFKYILFKTNLVVSHLICCFFLSLLSYIIRHHSLLRYFCSSDVDYWSIITFIRGGDIFVIIFKYHLILIQ